MKITTPHGTLEGDNIEAILKQYGLDCLCSADLSRADLCGADLSSADLCGADLSSADLSRADLCGADLRGANLRGACLYGACLLGANLRGACLYGAFLLGADLRYAYLGGANLHGADLGYADLRHANLSDADLSYADLSDADLRHANHVQLSIAKTSILPDEGDIIGWKKAYVDDAIDDATPVIVKLLIPADAQRSNCTGRKCRANTARVLDLQDKQGNSLPPDTTAYSSYDSGFKYQKGETVHVEDFDTNRWNECAPGIHFFITRIEAVEY